MADERDRLRKLRALEAQQAKPAIDPYYVRDPKTGLSPAQVEANKIVEETAKAVNAPIVELLAIILLILQVEITCTVVKLPLTAASPPLIATKPD